MWLQDPITKVFIKIIQDRKEKAYQTLIGASKEDLLELRERLKIYHSILDIERLFEGELEEDDK